MLGEVLSDWLEFLFTDLWVELTKATHERFGWVAATAVALSPIIILALAIWLVIVWATG